jgi:hypothetical protein
MPRLNIIWNVSVVLLYLLLLLIREKNSEDLKYLLVPRDSRLDTFQLAATENSEMNIVLTSTTKS